MEWDAHHVTPKLGESWERVLVALEKIDRERLKKKEPLFTGFCTYMTGSEAPFFRWQLSTT